MPPVDTRQFFASLKSAVARNPNKARKIGGSFQINILGSGSWGIDLSIPSVIEGQLADPNTTISISEADFQRLLANHAEATKMWFSGKLTVSGNQMLALNLPKLLALK